MVTRQSTSLRSSPTVVPHPHPALPLRDSTAVSPRQFAKAMSRCTGGVTAAAGATGVGAVTEAGALPPSQATSVNKTMRLKK